MEIKSKFDHFNINVLDLDRSIAFYNKALGLKEHHPQRGTGRLFRPRLPDGRSDGIPAGTDLAERPQRPLRTRRQRKSSLLPCSW